MADSVLAKKNAAFRVRIEPRLSEPPAWYPAAVSLGAIFVALILGGILIGKIPVGAVVPMFRGLLFFRPKIKYPVRG